MELKQKLKQKRRHAGAESGAVLRRSRVEPENVAEGFCEER